MLETHCGQQQETLKQAGGRTRPHSVGVTMRYGYKGQLPISMKCSRIYSIIHVTGMPMGLQMGSPNGQSVHSWWGSKTYISEFEFHLSGVTFFGMTFPSLRMRYTAVQWVEIQENNPLNPV